MDGGEFTRTHGKDCDGSHFIPQQLAQKGATTTHHSVTQSFDYSLGCWITAEEKVDNPYRVRDFRRREEKETNEWMKMRNRINFEAAFFCFFRDVGLLPIEEAEMDFRFKVPGLTTKK